MSKTNPPFDTVRWSAKATQVWVQIASPEEVENALSKVQVEIAELEEKINKRWETICNMVVQPKEAFE